MFKILWILGCEEISVSDIWHGEDIELTTHRRVMQLMFLFNSIGTTLTWQLKTTEEAEYKRSSTVYFFTILSVCTNPIFSK
jgi:hypothetical protein